MEYFNILSLQKNVNQSYIGILFYPSKNGYHQETYKQKTNC